MGLLNQVIKVGLPGDEVIVGNARIQSGICKTELKAGDFVTVDNAPGVYKKFTSGDTSAKVIGVVLRTLVNDPTQYPLATDDVVYKAGRNLNIAVGGDVFVTKDSVTPTEGEKVYLIPSSGKVTNVPSSNVEVLGARFGKYQDDKVVSIHLVY